MDDSDKKIATLVFVIFLVIAAYGGYRIIKGELVEGEVEEILVERGDTVKVNYTGLIYDGRIYGSEPRVFDTSLESVANDNTTNPKALSYTWRSGLTPLTFETGIGQVIQGWEINILGMKEGQTQTWTIPAQQAYNPRLDSLVITYEKDAVCPIYETLSINEFVDQYGGTAQIADTPLTHAYWGWHATVFEATDTEITILNTPQMGETYTTGYGWDTYVSAINQSTDGGVGEITLEHQPLNQDLIDLEAMAQFDPDMKTINDIKSVNQRPGSGIVTKVEANTFEVDYNSEVYGVDLIFTVTVLEIQKKV